jgi:DNA-binding MarR family transcriptional regulator
MKKSAFNLNEQNASIDSRIVASLERISQAFRVLLWQESKEHSLSPIQVQVLVFLMSHSGHMKKVSYLADEFNMTKATISDTIKVLQLKNLIRKETEQDDSRSYTIHLTEKGKQVARQIAQFAEHIQTPVECLHDSDKENLLLSLIEIIHHLNKSGVITIQRMCYTCQYYESSAKGENHFCRLMNKPLANHELRIDCPEHLGKQLTQ